MLVAKLEVLRDLCNHSAVEVSRLEGAHDLLHDKSIPRAIAKCIHEGNHDLLDNERPSLIRAVSPFTKPVRQRASQRGYDDWYAQPISQAR